MIFKYKAIANNGQRIEGVFEANTEADVVAMIRGNKYIPVQIERDVETESQIEIFSKKVKKSSPYSSE